MQRKYREIQTPISKLVQAFVSRHLRLSTLEEERLQLQLNPGWMNPKSYQTTEPTHPKRPSFHKCTGQNCSFLSLVQLFFSEVGNEPALDIHLMDTMFFLPDHTIKYIYRVLQQQEQDSRKGLVKIKQRGIMICDTFLKRRLRKKESFSRQKDLSKTKSTISFNDDKSQKTDKNIQANLDYFALLKYKDGSFLRLKETDLRSIFTNPLYANQRFRHNNCTQYIQALPSDESQEIRIHYNWYQFKEQPLFQMAKQCQLGKTPKIGSRQTLRSTLQYLNPTVYLYFSVFEICAYISIHYNKKIETAHFHFVCEDGVWNLATAESIKITSYPHKQYVRAELWESHKVQFGESKDQSRGIPIFEEKQAERSLLYQTIESFFDRTNTQIKKSTLDFVKSQIERVRKVQDQKLSKSIFDILHPGKGQKLYQCLDCPEKLKKTLNINDHIEAAKPRVSLKENRVKKITNKSTILQQMRRRQQQKQLYVYRGIDQ